MELWVIGCIQAIVLILGNLEAVEANCLKFFIKKGSKMKDFALQGHVIKSLKLTSSYECLDACAMNCACVSYNYDHAGHDCELNMEDNTTQPQALQPRNGFIYKELQIKDKSRDSCPAAGGNDCENLCCLPNPCQHDGECEEICDHHRRRFNCTCKQGYLGNLCQIPASSVSKLISPTPSSPQKDMTSSPEVIMMTSPLVEITSSIPAIVSSLSTSPLNISPSPEAVVMSLDVQVTSWTLEITSASLEMISSSVVAVETENVESCFDHLVKNRTAVSGIYNVTNQQTGNVFEVYCHMDHVNISAWTLIESYEYQTPINKPFMNDEPVNANSPGWDSYRMGLPRMKFIAKNSTHWRASCDYGKIGFDKVDLVQSKLSDFDIIMTEDSGDCHRLEYVNIVGTECIDQTMWLAQKHNKHLTIDKTQSTSCECQPVVHHNYFGDYKNGIDSTSFKCTSTPQSQTQFWLGKFMNE